MDFGAYVFTAATAYLLGSVPTGFVVGKAKGIDIRTVGSGNIGATNVFRILGKPAGIFVLVFDGLKGYAACGWLPDLVFQYVTNRFTGADRTTHEALRIIGGISAILGHNYTCWLKFRGGKGIATSAGVLAALVPAALIIIFIIWVVVFATTRYVSLSSISASVALPFAAYFTRNSLTIVGVTAAMAALAVYKHRSNIQRLLNGTESRFARKPKEQSP
ncbi:MAG: glycerol-3-phosphate 1-O-acyltransferase PlsY [Verrucomicrobia subdivision 3 bacterium]|nr:glycerol-3-phosphate 1-O-acyltransferase PlsY [Limisphaerales bacterium]